MPRKILRRGQDCTGVSLNQAGGNILLRLLNDENQPIGYITEDYDTVDAAADGRRFSSLVAARSHVTSAGYSAFPTGGKIQAFRLSDDGELLAVTNPLGFMHFHNSCSWSAHMWTHIVQANSAQFAHSHRYGIFGQTSLKPLREPISKEVVSRVLTPLPLIREEPAYKLVMPVVPEDDGNNWQYSYLVEVHLNGQRYLVATNLLRETADFQKAWLHADMDNAHMRMSKIGENIVCAFVTGIGSATWASTEKEARMLVARAIKLWRKMPYLLGPAPTLDIQVLLIRQRDTVAGKSNAMRYHRYATKSNRSIVRLAPSLPRFPELKNGKQYYIIEKLPLVHGDRCSPSRNVCCCDATYMSLSYTDQTKYWSKDIIHADRFWTVEDVRKAIAELLWADRRYKWHPWQYRVLVMQEDYKQEQDPIIAAGCFNQPRARGGTINYLRTKRRLVYKPPRTLIRQIPDVGSISKPIGFKNATYLARLSRVLSRYDGAGELVAVAEPT
jgi:hypothetical protein